MVITWLWCSSRFRIAVAMDGVAQHLTPLAEALGRRQADAAALVADRGEWEQGGRR